MVARQKKNKKKTTGVGQNAIWLIFCVEINSGQDVLERWSVNMPAMEMIIGMKTSYAILVKMLPDWTLTSEKFKLSLIFRLCEPVIMVTPMMIIIMLSKVKRFKLKTIQKTLRWRQESFIMIIMTIIIILIWETITRRKIQICYLAAL